METNPQPLTPKEKKVLEFLEGYIQHQGLSPTYQEIKDHFGFASFNSVQRYLKQLETKDYIHVPGGNRKRAISLLNPSSTVQSNVTSLMEAKASLNNGSHQRGASLAEPLSVPLLGKVAAGLPIEEITDNEFVDVPASFVRNVGKSYALQVSGQSMIEDGIHDGDVILVQEQNHANQGEIVVAMVENEATVKRFYLHRKEEPKVELRPANASMDPLWYQPEEVEIRGIVVGLLRRYF